ncbi:MAG: polysaccharide biosynthesis/export family protein [Vicingaceae bacterium]
MRLHLNKAIPIAVLFCLALVTSCIPTKKVVYLENFDGEEMEQYEAQNWEYKIQPGDRFYIKVQDPMKGLKLGTNEVSIEDSKGSTQNLIQQTPSVHDYQVQDNGKIILPVIGEVEAANKTRNEFHQEIVESCKGFISNPTVKVYMTNYNVTLLGEFNTPGFYQLITNQPTFFDAVGLGNDLTDFADRKRVKLIRKIDGKVKVYYLDVTDPAFVNSPYYYVQPNDVIHVMPLKVKKFSSDNALPLLLSGLTVIVTLANILSR